MSPTGPKPYLTLEPDIGGAMKRILVLMMISSLVLGAVTTAEAGKKKKKPKPRTIELRYENPAVGSPGVGGVCSGCPEIVVGSNEYFVSVVIEDDFSPAPAMRFSWDTDGDGRNDTGFTVCGAETAEPVAIPPGITMNAFPYILPGPACPTGFAVAGTIKLTFTSAP